MSGFLLAVTNHEATPNREFIGRHIGSVVGKLDELAVDMGVPPLSSFVTVDESDQKLLRQLAKEGGLDISDFGIEPVKWFDPAKGLRTVKALIKRLQDEPKSVKKTKAVLSELEELQTALITVKKMKARWRLWVDT